MDQVPGLNPDILNKFDFWLVFEFTLLFFLGFYVLFAVLVVRQTYLLSRTVQTGISPLIRILGWVHLVFAICVFIGLLLMLL